MPILPPETDQYPPDLMTALAPAGHPERQWYAVHVRPRQEKEMARHLAESAVPFYLPLVAKKGRYGRRLLTAYLPLFTSYLFMWASPQERLEALSTNRVVRTLLPPDPDKLWYDLRQLHQLIKSGAPVRAEDRIVYGDIVEIKSGALAGLQGKVLELNNRRHFVVEIDFIQKAAAVELEEGVTLEVIEKW